MRITWTYTPDTASPRHLVLLPEPAVWTGWGNVIDIGRRRLRGRCLGGPGRHGAGAFVGFLQPCKMTGAVLELLFAAVYAEGADGKRVFRPGTAGMVITVNASVLLPNCVCTWDALSIARCFW